MNDHSKLTVVPPNAQQAIESLQDFFELLLSVGKLTREEENLLKLMLRPVIYALGTTLNPEFIIAGWERYERDAQFSAWQRERWTKALFGQADPPLADVDINKSFVGIHAIITETAMRFSPSQEHVAKLFFLLLYMFELQLESQKTKVAPIPMELKQKTQATPPPRRADAAAALADADGDLILDDLAVLPWPVRLWQLAKHLFC